MLRATLSVLILSSTLYADSNAGNEAEPKILEALKEAGAELERDEKTGKLTDVEFENRDVTTETLELTSKLKTVEAIYLENCTFPGNDLTSLWALPNLQRLHFYGAIKAENLKGIENAKSLMFFGGGGAPVDSSVIQALARNKSLRYLSFRDAEITDEAIKEFTAIPQLYSFLVTGKHNITDASISHLNNMKRLLKKVPPAELKYRPNFEFGIDPCRFTDKGLQRLKHHEKYTQLIISGAPITDASLPVLKKFINCDRIDVRKTRLTEGAVKELAETLYLSEIDSDYEIAD